MNHPLVEDFHGELSVGEVVHYFQRFDEADKASADKHLSYPPFKPKAGQIYYFLPQDEAGKNDWRADGYRWYQYGTKAIPRREPVLKKVHFACRTVSKELDRRFRRLAYYLVSAKEPQTLAVLVQYIGDESIADEFPHGNVKDQDSPSIHYRTCPSVLTKISATTDMPSNVYKKAVSTPCPIGLEATCMPRNKKQVQNLQQKERQKSRLSHDALYNVHEIAYDLSDYVKIIVTYPDLVVICGLKELVSELDSILQLPQSSHPQCQLLSYDTTFQLGDFYLSPLLYRHTAFSGNPVVPALFLIHERKLQKCHEMFMEQLSHLVPALVKGKECVPMVTDEERGINVAIQKHLPNVKRLRCWNHTISALKLWLRKHGAASNEVPVYISHLRELLKQPDVDSYSKMLQEFQALWSQSFKEYYMREIDPEVNTTLGRWVLESLHVYHPFSGITNNQSEGFNSVLKRLQQWREVPLDSILFSLYHLQVYYYNEIQRGLAGLGDFKLLPEFLSLKRPMDEFSLMTSISPEEIVERCLDAKSRSCKNDAEVGSTTTCNDASTLTVSDKVRTADEILTPSDSLAISGTTREARARYIIENNLISHSQTLGIFTVQGTTGKAHAIRLFPKETCTCPSTTRCYHILAVRMSVGLEDFNLKRKINLTQLRRNVRSRREKKSGRKAPRPGDYDVQAAPDSVSLEIESKKEIGSRKEIAGKGCSSDPQDQCPNPKRARTVQALDTPASISNTQKKTAIKKVYSNAELAELLSSHSECYSMIKECSIMYMDPVTADDDFTEEQMQDETILLPGQFRLYKSLDVLFWLAGRHFLQRSPLPHERNFVIIDNDIEKEYETFREEIIKEHTFVESNDLLQHWSTVDDNSAHTVEVYGRQYFKFTDTELDSFCAWVQYTRDSLNAIDGTPMQNNTEVKGVVDTGDPLNCTHAGDRTEICPNNADTPAEMQHTDHELSQHTTKNRTKRCNQCKGCKSTNCGECKYCKDMKIFGGPGKKKKACMKRECTAAFNNTSAAVKTDSCFPAQYNKSSTSADIHSSSAFLSRYGRYAVFIPGDGNCLFRCFSYILYDGVQDQHSLLRSLIVKFMRLNSSSFTAFCHPVTVQEHTTQMEKLGVWGTHAEILAFAMCFEIPVYTAIQRTEHGPYYWAKYASPSRKKTYFRHRMHALPTRLHNSSLLSTPL